MKKLLLVMIFSVLSVCFATAKKNETVVLTTEQYEKLPVEIKNSIESEKKIEKTIGAVGKWSGLGKEIGEGVNSALMAIEGSATRISQTDLGKTAMFVVVWKFVGKDFLQIAVGLLVLMIGVPIIVKLINTNRPHRVLISKKFIKERLQFEKKYEQIEGDNEVVGWMVATFFILIGVVCFIMFI